MTKPRFKTCCAKAEVALPMLPEESCDALVTDPPGGIEIFGNQWDSDRGGRDQWVAWLAGVMKEALRVLKPGSYGVVWAFPKTSHWTTWALENAGFSVITILHHHYSQGMPKHKSQIKPATEHWVLVKKPTSLTYEENARRYGTGLLNIDACRIERALDDVPGWHLSGAKGSGGFQDTGSFAIHDMTPEEIQERCGGKGRWPADALFSHDPRCILVGSRKVKGCPATVIQGGKDGGGYDPDSGDGSRRGVFEGYGDEDGMEEVDEFACVPSCPVRLLDAQFGKRKSGKVKASDVGGVSRCFKTFHYCSKAPKSEKNAGLFGVIPCARCGGIGTTEHVDAKTGKSKKCLLNDHGTVKSVELMRWLCRLTCPPGGVIVDPFMGSGTTGVAAILEGFQFLGGEMEERSHLIARARLAWAEREG